MNLRTVLVSESIKLLSLRSTRWTLLGLIVGTVGFGALASYNIAGSDAGLILAGQMDQTAVTLAGLTIGALALAALGTLTMSAEYSTGAIRGTFTAVPRRGLVLTAKVILVAAIGLVAGLVSSFAAFFVGMIFFDRHQLGVGLGDPGVLRAVLGGGLYAMACGLFGFALGALLRHTAGAVTLAIAGLFVLPGLTTLLPGGWGRAVHDYFTTNPGMLVLRAAPEDGGLGPWAGYGVFSLWWFALVVVAVVLVRRRDA